jgi:type II secretory pathway pseudopilin PulG
MNLDTIITILVIGSFAVSIISSLSRARSDSEKRAQEQGRLQRELQELERKRREGNPDTQSMQSYLERTKPGRLEDGQDDFAQPTRPAPRPGSFAADMAQSGSISEQERLRREMARKMGQTPSSTTASTTSARGQSLEELLRDFTQAVESRPSQPTPASRTPINQGRTTKPPAPTARPAPRAAPTTIESTIRPSVQTSTLETQGSVVNVSAAAAERAMALERESQGASIVSKGSATRSWESATTGDIVRAIIWTEILNPPKSRRR